MNVTILDPNLIPISVIDSYKSFIWTDRYDEAGDFELYTSAFNKSVKDICLDGYVRIKNSEHLMLVEKILIESDVEEGSHATISGRSIEVILERRILWEKATLKGNLQNEVKRLIEENIVSPTDESRKIDNFIFEVSDDPIITALEIDAQYDIGENLYDIVKTICSDKSLGFKITVDDNQQFIFKLYAGTDRSFEQTENPGVIFSPMYDNLINSNYVESLSSFKNLVLVQGKQNGATVFETVGDVSGLNRRETYVNATDITSGDDIRTMLQQRGKEELNNYSNISSIEGEVDVNLMYKYGEDFFNGDIVQIANEYGNSGRARITEIVTSVDENGTSVYPNFKTIT